MRVLTVIPARRGSKGLPLKNLRMLCGKPMMAYIIEAARQVQGIDRVMMSTEDPEIAEVARRYGAETPFLRPAHLSEDHVPTLPILQHAIDYCAREEQYHPDYVLLVYPTSPLLKPERLQQAIDLAQSTNANSVISGTYVGGHYWQRQSTGWRRLYPTAQTLGNRQQNVPLFKENGAIYLNRTEVLREQIVAEPAEILLMDPDENIDVDALEDFQRVERRMQGIV